MLFWHDNVACNKTKIVVVMTWKNKWAGLRSWADTWKMPPDRVHRKGRTLWHSWGRYLPAINSIWYISRRGWKTVGTFWLRELLKTDPLHPIPKAEAWSHLTQCGGGAQLQEERQMKNNIREIMEIQSNVKRAVAGRTESRRVKLLRFLHLRMKEDEKEDSSQDAHHFQKQTGGLLLNVV